eukprot:1146218-Pelagomonas_calceolata.AAC.2
MVRGGAWSGAPPDLIFPPSQKPLESLPMTTPQRSSGTGNSCQHMQAQQSKQQQWKQERKRATVLAAMGRSSRVFNQPLRQSKRVLGGDAFMQGNMYMPASTLLSY